MKWPNQTDCESLIGLTDEALQDSIAAFGLPEEFASRWYAYLEDNKPDSWQTVNHYLNLSFSGV